MIKNIGMIILIFVIAIVIIVICFLDLASGLKSILLVSLSVLFILSLLLHFLPKDSDYFKNLILASGVAVTIVSWFIVGHLNSENESKRSLLEFERSTNQSKRDLKVKFLIDAYFRLENSDFRDTFPKGIQPELYDRIYLKYAESALTSVQLLGSDSTVKLANLYILSGGKEHFQELLISLRNELRLELGLQQLPNTTEYSPSVYRTYRKLNAPNNLTAEEQFQLTLKLCEFDRGLLK